jgi:exonuclease SbcC
MREATEQHTAFEEAFARLKEDIFPKKERHTSTTRELAKMQEQETRQKDQQKKTVRLAAIKKELEQQITHHKDQQRISDEAKEMLEPLLQNLAKAEQEAEDINLPDLAARDNCPTCGQDLTDTHKQHLQQAHKQQKETIQKKIQKYKEAIQKRRDVVDAAREIPRKLQEALSQHAVIEADLRRADEQEKEAEKLQKEYHKLKEESNRLKEQLTMAEQSLKETEEKRQEKKERLDATRKRYDAYKEYRLKQEQRKERTAYAEKLKKSLATLAEEMLAIKKDIAHLNEQLQDRETIKKAHDNAREHLTKTQKDAVTLTATLAAQQEKDRSLKERHEHLQGQIEQRKKIQQQAQHTGHLIEWLRTTFSDMMQTIEQHVFLSVYHEFNELFVTWLSALIEDESIQGRLDCNFAPIIEQNGYEIEVSCLSGGERTCVALAYRLALNKVVNDIIQTIHTRDILILDEPTEGFSREQLDRVRDVLEQIALRQLIIVSHDPKVETFVDNVLTVQKTAHTSSVTTA